MTIPVYVSRLLGIDIVLIQLSFPSRVLDCKDEIDACYVEQTSHESSVDCQRTHVYELDETDFLKMVWRESYMAGFHGSWDLMRLSIKIHTIVKKKYFVVALYNLRMIIIIILFLILIARNN